MSVYLSWFCTDRKCINHYIQFPKFRILVDLCSYQKVYHLYNSRFIPPLDKYGKIDVLVINAGFGFAGAIEETRIAEAREVFEANFFGAFQVTQTFLGLFRQQKSGHTI